MKRLTNSKGFTLVELLIVIALIAILSVAVLATINPIEQANKAKDAATQNDAAEVMNAYERMYANSQTYPWTGLTDNKGVEDPVSLASNMVGFGICGLGTGVSGASNSPLSDCNTNGALIISDELKTSFKGKLPFTSTAKVEDRLYMTKGSAVSSSIYVCYVPKAKSNRNQTAKLRCIVPSTSGGGVLVAGATGCAAPASTGGTEWGSTTGIGESIAHFICVPE